MPFYDLHCADCSQDFNIRASVSEKTERRIVCPQCGSNHMETIYRPLNVHVKSGISAPPACPNSHVCGAQCRHGQ